MLSDITDWIAKRKEAIGLWATLALTPLFYVASFPPFNVPEGAYVFLIPFFLWLRLRPGNRTVLWASFAVGWLSWIVLIFWLRHVSVFGMLLLAAVVGAHFALWALGAAWMSRRFFGNSEWRNVVFAFGVSALWIAVEWLRTWIFTGFPWLPLSASQWDRPIMLQGAALMGAWGISFTLVLINAGIAAYAGRLAVYPKTKKLPVCYSFYLALLFTVWATFMQSPEVASQKREHLLNAGVMQPAVPQGQKWDVASRDKILERIKLLTTGVALETPEPEALFWPESVLPYAYDNPYGGMKAWMAEIVQIGKAPIVFGALGVDDWGGEKEVWYNSIFEVDPDIGAFPQRYSKRHLVPFGEYIPLEWLWPWMDKIVPLNGNFAHGDEVVLIPVNTKKGQFDLGPLICFEDLFPGLARDVVNAGAELLFVATNGAWYGESAMNEQHMAHSALRAIENRRIVLRVGNNGWTGWIDEFGNVRDSLKVFDANFASWEVTRDQRWKWDRTFYTRYGDWFVWVCLAGVVVVAVLGCKRKPVEN